MQLKQNKLKNARKIILPALTTFFVLIVLFRLNGLAPFGTRSLVVMDADIQYLDFFCYFKDVLEGKNSIGYSFCKTLGGSNIAVFSYYLSSPFNLLLLFFKRSQLHTFFDLVVALKLALSSMTFAYFGLKRFESRKTAGFSAALFLMAVGYGLCQYNIAQSSNIMWLDGVYMLPLILLQVSNIVNGKKSRTLPLFVGAAIIFNWYSAGIDCIFSAFWFVFEVILYAVDKKFEIKYFIRCSVKYLVEMISGVMVSAVLFLPTIGALRNSTRGTLHLGDLLDFSLIGELPSAIQNYTYGAVSEYGKVALFCGSLAIVLAIFAALHSGSDVRKRTVFAGLLLGSVLIFYWHPLFTVFSLFQWVSSYHYRYSYVAAFSILFLALVGANEMNGKQQARQLLKIAIAFSGLLIVLHYCKAVNDSKYVYATATMVVLETVVFLCIKTENQKKLWKRFFAVTLAIVGVIDLAVNTKILLKPYSVDEVVQNNAYIENQGKTIASIKAADQSLYRISQTTTRNMGTNNLTAYYNEGLAYNYASISGYTSSPDDVQRNFLDKLGYPINGENMCITNTSILGADSLLGVKYVLSPYDIQGLTEISEEDGNGKSVYLNTYAFPAAFVYDDTGYAVKDTTNPFEYQNELYKQLFGTTVELYSPVEYDAVYGDGSCGAKMQLHVPGEANIAVYGNIPWNYDADSSIYINGTFVTKYACWLSPTVFYIPITEGQECEVEVQSNADNFNWDSVQFYALNLDVLEKCSDTANAGMVDNIAVTNGYVEVSVNSEENERLFLSVPSEQNWVITLNGEPAETELIGDCLYSIKLTNGINNITMTYHIRYFKLGILVTVFTLFCYIGYVLLRKKAYNKNWCKEA